MKPFVVDKELQAWQGSLTTISRNLTTLTEAEFVKRIKNRAKGFIQPAYEGETRTQALEAFKVLANVSDDYLLLGQVIDEATKLSKKSSVFHSYDDEIKALLDGPSIKMPTVHVALPNRDLLSATDSADMATPTQIRDAMQSAFAQARDILTGIDAVETEAQNRLYALQQELLALSQLAVALGVSAQSDLQQRALTKVASDPLAQGRKLDELEGQIGTWRSQLEGLENEQTQAKAGLVKAETALQELQELGNRSRQAIEESKATFLDTFHFSEPLQEEVLLSLKAWLATLADTLSAKRWKAAGIGLSRFDENVAARLNVERTVYANNRTGLDEVANLKGRFKALQFKARAKVAKGVVLTGTLEGLQQKIEETFSQKPLSLVELRKVVSAFETALMV